MNPILHKGDTSVSETLRRRIYRYFVAELCVCIELLLVMFPGLIVREVACRSLVEQRMGISTGSLVDGLSYCIAWVKYGEKLWRFSLSQAKPTISNSLSDLLHWTLRAPLMELSRKTHKY